MDHPGRGAQVTICAPLLAGGFMRVVHYHFDNPDSHEVERKHGKDS